MQRFRFMRAQLSRRQFLAGVGGAGLAGMFSSAWSGTTESAVDLPFVNGRREVATNFPQKGDMILQRTRPPLLETPFEVFDQGIFTPNDRFLCVGTWRISHRHRSRDIPSQDIWERSTACVVHSG